MTKSEIAVLKELRKNLSTEHLAKCAFRAPDGDSFNKKYSAEIAEATRIYRESWVLPLIDALLDDKNGTYVKAQGWTDRAQALKEMAL